MESNQPGELGFASNATFDPDGALVLNPVATGALVRDIYCPDICFIFHTSSLKISKIFTILIIDIIIMLIPITTTIIIILITLSHLLVMIAMIQLDVQRRGGVSISPLFQSWTDCLCSDVWEPLQNHYHHHHNHHHHH